MEQVQFAATSPIRGFPSLVFGDGDTLVPVKQDYLSAQATLEHLETLQKTG